jgi:hypothetical protein
MRRYVFIFIVLAILTPVIGYAMMHGAAHLIPMSSDGTASQILLAVLIIGIAITVPYLMLKASFFSAHAQNPRKEKELNLKDIPKDKEQAAKKKN